MASGNQHPVFARGDKKQPGTQKRRSRFDRYGDTPDSLIDDLTMLKATAEARLRICGDDHKAAAALIRESRCIDEAVAKIHIHPECPSNSDQSGVRPIRWLSLGAT